MKDESERSNQDTKSKEYRQRIKKTDFVVALASFLTRDQAKKSIILQIGPLSPAYTLAQDWAEMRNLLGLTGYPTFEEAHKALMELLK